MILSIAPPVLWVGPLSDFTSPCRDSCSPFVYDLPGLCGIVAKQVGVVLGNPKWGKPAVDQVKTRPVDLDDLSYKRDDTGPMQDFFMAIFRDLYQPTRIQWNVARVLISDEVWLIGEMTYMTRVVV